MVCSGPLAYNTTYLLWNFLMNIIVLEHPRIISETKFNDIASTPLWSCIMGGYVAAGLKKGGHDVIFFDAAVRKWNFDRTLHGIKKNNPEMICINAVYFWEHTLKLFDFLDDIKKEECNAHINLFGFFPTLAHEPILKNYTAVDSIALGECENTVLLLAERLQKKQSWHDIDNIAYAKEKKISINRKGKHLDPDLIPFPMRELKYIETASILASRGCYNHCTFCPIPPFYAKGPLWRGRSPQNVYNEIKQLKDYGISDFYFVDPNFIGPGSRGKQRIIELMDLLTPLNITFGMETRVNDLDDEKIVNSLAKAGLKSLLLGVESASSSVLKEINKKLSRKDSENAIRLLRNVGIEPEIGFLMFVPESNVDDIKQNFDFLLQNNLLDRLDRTANLLSHCQIVLMGTSGYRHFKSQGRLTAFGLHGFEGEISYKDPRVKWMAQIVVPVCQEVLRKISCPESLLYWQRPTDPFLSLKVNNYLVETFKDLLFQIENNKTLYPYEDMCDDLIKKLNL